MHSKSQEVLQKLLQVEAKKTAYRLGLRKVSSPEPLSYEFVRRAIGTLEGLANLNDEKSRTEFIAISALLWTLAADTYQGIRDHLVVLLAKIGLFGGFCGRDSGIGPAQRAKTTIWN